ncbi:polysaccharide lyase 6 family protein [Gilvimarinus sp. 1_MG-2023]|uniref:polysaccharide lyase 6 family protein n=1 Tax=Gilvimarinus sp. 1_MG-2023 TaxID=3062638 RepID=UPI0026E42374|nr:polysaccharide lyase 6 family protein [Gilvimarinus sp. 1_MG-2023]MDO6746425.1 polysaccharide lyase 6 family protein [Gilvimarinus sp. 1_MG-2023]
MPEINCTQVVASISALEDAAGGAMAPGTTLCLADGQYSNLDIDIGGAGTPEQPITVAAQNPGQVTIGGEVKVEMGGSYVVLQGFIFKDGESASSNMIATRLGSGDLCSHCRITENAIIDMDVGRDSNTKWVYDYGEFTRIDHNWFAGKTTRGALLVVDRWIPDGQDPSTAQVDYTKIDHNYFGDRAPTEGKAYADSGDNEYEAVRIGLSTTHEGDSFSVVAHNYFERIDGEAEVISNKATNNSIVHNTVRDSYGSITTRHGGNATIAHNFMFGDGHPFAGGLRLIDGGHRVVNNYIEGARYKNTTHHGGIVLMGADSSPSASGYQQLEDSLISYNTVVDSINSLNVDGGKKSKNPKDLFLVNNLIAQGIGPVLTQMGDGMPSGSEIAGNIIYGQSLADDGSNAVSGMNFVDAKLEKGNDGLWRPSDNSPNLSAVAADMGSFANVDIDMDGQARGSNTIVGADHVASGSATWFPITPDQVGPKSYTPSFSAGFVKRISLENVDFDDGGQAWSFSGSAQVSNDSDKVFSRGASAVVSGAGQLSQSVDLEANTLYTLSAFVKGPGEFGVKLANGDEFMATDDSSDFEFRSVTFNSGNNTSADIIGRMPATLSKQADIENPDFPEGTDDSDITGWETIENVGDDQGSQGLGNVGSSNNSAFGDKGSVQLGYSYPEDENSTPTLYQIIDGVLPNTEYTLSMYLLVKSTSNSTATFGAQNEAGSVTLGEKIADYDQLESSGAPESSEDGYYQASMTFNSGDNTSVRIFAQFNAESIANNPGGTEQMDSDTRKIYELRVDNFELTYEAAPSSDDEASFDGFRLVSHVGGGDS